jgi:hypothetical protein
MTSTINGPNSRAWKIGGALFLVLIGLLGNAVRDSIATAKTERAELEARLDAVEERVATIQVNRFTNADGLALELHLTEHITDMVDRMEAKIDELERREEEGE